MSRRYCVAALLILGGVAALAHHSGTVQLVTRAAAADYGYRNCYYTSCDGNCKHGFTQLLRAWKGCVIGNRAYCCEPMRHISQAQKKSSHIRRYKRCPNGSLVRRWQRCPVSARTYSPSDKVPTNRRRALP
jgi:hypothetical protein